MHYNELQYVTIRYNTLQYLPIHSNTCQYMPIHANTCQYMPIHANTFQYITCITYIRMYVPTYLHTYIPTCLPTYMPTYLQTCRHTPTRLQNHTNIFSKSNPMISPGAFSRKSSLSPWGIWRALPRISRHSGSRADPRSPSLKPGGSILSRSRTKIHEKNGEFLIKSWEIWEMGKKWSRKVSCKSGDVSCKSRERWWFDHQKLGLTN